jgi:hypothetical protein
MAYCHGFGRDVLDLQLFCFAQDPRLSSYLVRILSCHYRYMLRHLSMDNPEMSFPGAFRLQRLRSRPRFFGRTFLVMPWIIVFMRHVTGNIPGLSPPKASLFIDLTNLAHRQPQPFNCFNFRTMYYHC